MRIFNDHLWPKDWELAPAFRAILFVHVLDGA